ncbi:hypothetical protein [Parachlamydia sp. AcF125]|uniref:hypothetical protein n=1 Tax=Parachlamydia sp. AcF125 TaxID=2795736 RepID=UPI001BCA4159|nr:hypothetical protein [Parachlamydia sp. AcF125]MBS4168330.1 hypothetical protein [Parachlamydia sp. AcF125]
MNSHANNYNYLYLEPGYYARFNKDVGNSQLEIYRPNTKTWVAENNPKMIRRFNQDGSQISYQEFLEHNNEKNNPSFVSKT